MHVLWCVRPSRPTSTGPVFRDVSKCDQEHAASPMTRSVPVQLLHRPCTSITPTHGGLFGWRYSCLVMLYQCLYFTSLCCSIMNSLLCSMYTLCVLCLHCLFSLDEFQQMEMLYFCHSSESHKAYIHWQKQRLRWWKLVNPPKFMLCASTQLTIDYVCFPLPW